MKNIYQDNIKSILKYLNKKKYEILAADMKGINLKNYKPVVEVKEEEEKKEDIKVKKKP